MLGNALFGLTAFIEISSHEKDNIHLDIAHKYKLFRALLKFLFPAELFYCYICLIHV